MIDETLIDDAPDSETAEAELVAVHGPFHLTATAVEETAPATFDDWEAALKWCQSVEKASPWWVGDLVELGEARWGEKYAQALDHTQYSEQALRDIAYVARSVAPATRHANVSFTNHREVAPLPPSQQAKWLDVAEQESLTQAQLRVRIKVEKAATDGPAVELWLTVKCASISDQEDLAERMRQEGRTVKLHSKTDK